jgi:uncharacterized protein (TIGR03435 family)
MRTMSTAAARATIIVVAALGRAQSFEVASIKQNKSEDPRLGMQYLPGGKFSATNTPLYVIIANAYGVSFQSVRLSGGPDWIRSERYDIEATAEQGAIPVGASPQVLNGKMRLMLQRLLAERFKLTVRREMKEIPVYSIAVSKTGPKLKKSAMMEKDCPANPATRDVSCHSPSGGQGRGVHGKALSMSDLAGFVENWTDRPMVNRTGIQGLFDIDTDGWTPLLPRQGPAAETEGADESKALADPSRPTLFDVFEQLGLKLERDKAPIETFVIEHVERSSEN